MAAGFTAKRKVGRPRSSYKAVGHLHQCRTTSSLNKPKRRERNLSRTGFLVRKIASNLTVIPNPFNLTCV
jgi:hypothetical protein